MKTWSDYFGAIARSVGGKVFIQPNGDSHLSCFWRWLGHDSAPLTFAEIVRILHRCASY